MGIDGKQPLLTHLKPTTYSPESVVGQSEETDNKELKLQIEGQPKGPSANVTKEPAFDFVNDYKVENGKTQDPKIAGMTMSKETFLDQLTSTLYLMMMLVKAVKSLMTQQKNFNETKLESETLSSEVKTTEAKRAVEVEAQKIQEAKENESDCDIIVGAVMIAVTIILAAFTGGAALALTAIAIALLAAKLAVDLVKREMIRSGDYEGAESLSAASEGLEIAATVVSSLAGAPAMIKSIAKTAVKLLTKLTRKMLKTAIKQATKAALKEGVKEAAKQGKTLSETAVKKVIEKTAKQVAKRMVRLFIKGSGKKAGEVATKTIKQRIQQFAKKIALKNIGKALKNAAKGTVKRAKRLRHLKSDTTDAAQQAAKSNMEKALKAAEKTTIKLVDVTEDNIDDLVKKYLPEAMKQAKKAQSKLLKLSKTEWSQTALNMASGVYQGASQVNMMLYKQEMAEAKLEGDQYKILMDLMNKVLENLGQLKNSVNEESKKRINEVSNALKSVSGNFAQALEAISALGVALSPGAE